MSDKEHKTAEKDRETMVEALRKAHDDMEYIMYRTGYADPTPLNRITSALKKNPPSEGLL